MDPDGIASRILLFLGILVLGVFGQGGSVSTTAANFGLTSDRFSETHDGQTSASARGEITQISSSVSTADSLLDTSPLPRSSDSTNAPSTQAPSTTTTNAPSTQAPTTTTTNAPSTQAPTTTTTNAPSTQEPTTTTTNAPSTQATTTTNAPSTQATTTTNAPSTQAPTTTTTTTALITHTSTISPVLTTSIRMTSSSSSSGTFSPTTPQSGTLRIPTTAGGVVGENGDDGGGGLGTGLTAGLIVIVLTLVILLSSLVVCFFCYVRRGRKEMEKEREIQRRARKSASDNGHVTHANYAFSSDDAEKAPDITPTRPSDVSPPAVAPPAFSIFTTSDAKTTEEERMRTMSKKAKEAIEAGQTPPAVRAMRLLRESHNTSLKTRAEGPVGTQQSGTHAAGVDDLNFNHMNHHITGDDDGESDFDYGDLKLDLTGLRDPTDNSESYHVAPSNKALHDHSSDSSEFEFDEEGKTGESARRRKQTHHKGTASSEPQRGYTVSSDAETITPPKPDVNSSPNAQEYGLQPLGTPSRMRKAQSIPDGVLTYSEGSDENNASRSSQLPPIRGVTAPLVSHASSSQHATDQQPTKHKSSNNRTSQSYLKSVLATPTRTRKKETGAVKTPLDIFATPNLNRKSVNLGKEKEWRDCTLEPTGRSGSYLDLSARALKKDEEKRRGSISKPPVGTVDAKPTSKPDKEKEADKSHDSAKKEAVELVSKYEKKTTTEDDDDSLARRREKHRQRYRSKHERPDSEDRHEKRRPEVSNEPSLSQSDRTKPDPDSRRRSHSRSRKYDDGPSQPDARRERSRRSSRANTDEQERDVSESRNSQTGSRADRPEHSKHRETRSKSDDVRKSRSSHKTDDESREKRGASNQRRYLSDEDSKQQFRDTETSDDRSRSRRHRHRESRDASHRHRKRSDSTERPLASDETDDKRTKVASDMSSSINHAEIHDKRRHSSSAQDNSSSEHHKRKHHREDATDEKLSRDSTSKDRHRHRNRKRDGKEETREEAEARRERRRRRKERSEAKKSAADVPKARVVMVGNSQSDDDDDSSDSDDVDPSTPNPTTATELTLDDLASSSMEV